jgi:hypothetical protein
MSDAVEAEALAKTYNEGQRSVTPVETTDWIRFTPP